MAKPLLFGLLVLVACSSGERVDTAFGELDAALPSQLRRVTEDGDDDVRSARYEVMGEPAETAALVRASMVEYGFTLYDDPGLPDPSVSQPEAAATSLPSPVSTEPPPVDAIPPPVDAIQIHGFRGKRDRGMMRSLSFHRAPRPGWTVVIVRAALQD